MDIGDFGTEHFFDKYEFVAKYQLCNSDCETITIEQLFDLAGMDLEDLTGLSLGYTEATGRPELKELIASTYESVKSDDVVVANSPVEGLYLSACSLLKEGDEVIILNPCYEALVNPFSLIVGKGNIKKWNLTPNGQGWELSIDDLTSLISERTKVIVINFPHNPTGFVPTVELYDQIFEIAAVNDLWVLSDEMYSQLSFNNEPLTQAVDVYDKAVSLCGLSKSEGLPGVRAGWLIVKVADLRDRIINWKFYTSNCPNIMTETVSIAALKVRAKLVSNSIDQIKHNLAIANKFFQDHSDTFIWRPPVAGPIALVEMPGINVTEYADQLAKDQGILILPGETFGASKDFWRIGLGRKAFGNALDALHQYLKSSK